MAWRELFSVSARGRPNSVHGRVALWYKCEIAGRSAGFPVRSRTYERKSKIQPLSGFANPGFGREVAKGFRLKKKRLCRFRPELLQEPGVGKDFGLHAVRQFLKISLELVPGFDVPAHS